MSFGRCVVGWAGVIFALVAAGQARGGWTFSEVGMLPYEGPDTVLSYSSTIHSVSDAGSGMVGECSWRLLRSSGSEGSHRAWCRWEDGEITELTSPLLERGAELYISADSSTFVTWNTEGVPSLSNPPQIVPLRWRDGILGVMAGNYDEATAVPRDLSADGSVVVGTMGHNTRSMAYRWEDGDVTPLGAIGGTESAATGVSADGSVVVGYTGTLWDNKEQAFRWENGVMVGLGTLDKERSRACDVSADGSVVVGTVYADSPHWMPSEAFRWEDGVMVGLGTLGGEDSGAGGVSVDGSVVWGYSHISAGESEPFIWDAEHGMRSLLQMFSSDGVDLEGWRSWGITYVSPALDRIIGNARMIESNLPSATDPHRA